MKMPRMGRVQLRIMQVLWEQGQATAKEITETLNRSGPVAHSTVQTLLRKLEAKGAVAHDVRERTFVFHPCVHEQEMRRSLTHDLIGRVFEGSASGLVAFLVREERLSTEELERIRQIVSEGKDHDDIHS